MTDDLDPRLLALFEEAREEPTDNGFSSATLQRLQARQRRRNRLKLVPELCFVVLVVLLAEPLQAFLLELVPPLSGELFAAGGGIAGQLVQPVNSLAGLLGLVFVFVVTCYKRILR